VPLTANGLLSGEDFYYGSIEARPPFSNFIDDDCISHTEEYHIEENPNDGMNDFDSCKI